MSLGRDIKKGVRKITPRWVLGAYHAVTTWLAMLAYGFPANNMKVIGVTGTDGKTSTVNFISSILTEAGYKTGFTSTASNKVGNKTRMNQAKITMLGRWHLARLLHEMRKAGADYVIVETSSEGLAQNRHVGIAYDVAVFTNLSPDHIESHGTFEKYRAAKEKLFSVLSKTKRKPQTPKISVVNLDDENAEHFLAYDADQKWGFGLTQHPNASVQHVMQPSEYSCAPSGVTFALKDGKTGEHVHIKTKLVGNFNLKNMLAAGSAARSQGVSLDVIKQALEKLEPVPGRMEPIDEGQPFTVIVDYAHAPAALELVYKTLKEQLDPGARLIAVTGAAGGGRDKRKRGDIGRLAGAYAHFTVVTNEDPYDEDPDEIIAQVAAGVRSVTKTGGATHVTLSDRVEGIRRALREAKSGDVVIITGKGCEPIIMGAAGKRIPHDDRVVVRKLLAELARSSS